MARRGDPCPHRRSQLNGELIIKEHAELDRDTLSTIASIEEMINDKGYRTLRVKQHDRLQALTLLARISGMLINRQEISGHSGGPVDVDHTIDHSARIRTGLDAIAARLPPPTGQPIIDARSEHNRVPANRLMISV